MREMHLPKEMLYLSAYLHRRCCISRICISRHLMIKIFFAIQLEGEGEDVYTEDVYRLRVFI
jgi:hypothetical protein